MPARTTFVGLRAVNNLCIFSATIWNRLRVEQLRELGG